MNKLILMIPVLAAGCIGAGTNPHDEYGNRNNGARANLSFGAPSVTALGEVAPVIVSRDEEGTYHCATHENFYSGGSSVSCTFAGQISPVAQILSADCQPAGCKAAITSNNLVETTAQTAGAYTVTVSAKLADGTVLEDSTQVSFANVDGISLACQNSFSCPGPNAVFVGTTFSWGINLTNAGQPVSGHVGVSVEPEGIVELHQDSAQFSVRTLKPGTVTLRAHAGKVEKSLTVRVVAVDEVVAGSVHLRREYSCTGGVCADESFDLVGELAPASLSQLSPTFVLVWTTAEGTRVLGGAGRLRSPTPGVEVLVTGGYEFLPADLSLMVFTLGGTGGALCHPGKNSLTARMGNATLDWSIDQTCG